MGRKKDRDPSQGVAPFQLLGTLLTILLRVLAYFCVSICVAIFISYSISFLENNKGQTIIFISFSLYRPSENIFPLYHPLYQYVVPCGVRPKFLHKQLLFVHFEYAKPSIISIFSISTIKSGTDCIIFWILTACGSEKSGRSLSVRLKKEGFFNHWIILLDYISRYYILDYR